MKKVVPFIIILVILYFTNPGVDNFNKKIHYDILKQTTNYEEMEARQPLNLISYQSLYKRKNYYIFSTYKTNLKYKLEDELKMQEALSYFKDEFDIDYTKAEAKNETYIGILGIFIKIGEE